VLRKEVLDKRFHGRFLRPRGTGKTPDGGERAPRVPQRPVASVALVPQSPDSDPPRLQDDKPAYQSFSVLRHQVHDRLCHGSACRCWKPQQQDAACGRPLGEHELAEVLVFSKEHSILANGTIGNYVVLCAWGNVTHGRNIEPGIAEGTYDCEVTTFIGQKAHASSLGRPSPSGSHRQVLLVSHNLCGVGNRRPDVLPRQARIRV